nr:hypothetical protein [Micromonospora sp. NBRC 107566]
MDGTAGLLAGAAAGAAGTAALNAATYLDMAVRGRPASDTPERTVEAVAGRAHLPIPGKGEKRSHRVTALGALSGMTTGVAVGVAAAALHRLGVRPPTLVGAALTGLVAMAATDASMAGLKVTDPRTWSATDWISDLLPHFVYGAVTYATLRALHDPTR